MLTNTIPTYGFVSLALPPAASAAATDLVWATVLAEYATALSYLSIAIAMLTFAHRRNDLSLGGVAAVVSAFLLLGASDRLVSVWSIWHPSEGVPVAVKLATAIVSFVTAVALWPLLSRARSMPSSEHLRAANSALQAEIAERMRVEAMLRQAQKVGAVGQLTGGVAHDFNNLLTVVSGNVELAARALQLGGTVKVDRHLTNALQGVEQAKVLTGRLLAFSAQRSSDARPADVNAMIGGMSELLTRALGEAVEVRATLAPSVGTVEVDRNQFEAALLNLAVDARDAMTDGDIPSGILTIATANVALGSGDALPHDDVVPGEYVAISVGDTGTGMVTALTERAIDPRFTTKAAGLGAELGLSQVLAFVKQAGGHLRIESEVGSGTTVRLYLPRVDAVSAVGTTDATTTLLHARGETVLVVEDDASVRAYVVESLRDIGYTVIEAPDAAEALAQLDRTRLGATSGVDVLLTDIVMPRMSGRALADAARERHPGMRVLFMTGFAPRGRGNLDPRVTTISKPFTLVELAAKLREVLEASASSSPRMLATLLGESRW